MSALLRFLHNVAVALDYGMSMLLWLHPEEPMTISSRAGLALRAGERWTVLAMLARALNAISAGHCEAAISADVARAKAALRRLILIFPTLTPNGDNSRVSRR
jgi:hypothetical protein